MGIGRRAASLFALTLVVAASRLPAAGDPKEAFVRKVIAAYGGEKALAKVTRLRQSGVVASPTRGESRMVRLWESPGRLRVDIEFRGEAGEQRILDGTVGWRNGVAVAGPQLLAMQLQEARLRLPLVLLRELAKVEDRGTIVRNGATLRRLRLPFDGGFHLDLEVDAESGRILRSTGVGGAIAGQPLEFSTDYSDFRTVEGVLFPFVETSFAMGNPTGETTFSKMEVPAAFPPETFRPHGVATTARRAGGSSVEG